MEKEILKCRICDHDNNNGKVETFKSTCKFLDKEELLRYKCNNCGVIFGTEKILTMDEDELGDLYNKLYKNYSEGPCVDIQEYNLSLAYQNLKNNTEKVLNWGCGKIPISQPYNKKNNTNAIDYDIIKFHSHMIDDISLFKGESLGAIVSNNVIEHFQNPVEVFKKMNSIIKVNGYMVHSSPCVGEYGYQYEYTRFHTFFYTGNSIEVLAKKTGFKVINQISKGNVVYTVFNKIENLNN
jgi:hypothetical protein